MLTTHLAGIMLAEEGLSPTRSIPKTSTSLKWDAGFKYVLWAYMDWRHLHFHRWAWMEPERPVVLRQFA